MKLHESWTDSDVGFGGLPEEITYTEIQTNHLDLIDTRVWVHDCIFELNSQYSGNGGAISCSTEGQMLVEMSTFSECTCTLNGGAIYKKNGQSIIKKCCSIKCYSTGEYEGQFIYNYLSSIDQKNRVLDSSISNSMQNREHPSHGYTLYLWFGTIQIKTVNLSNNICDSHSAIYSSPYSSSSIQCSISYSSINSNEANQNRIIFFETNTKNEISQSNIINNIVPSNSKNGLIHCNGPTNINDCCIMNNEAKYIIAGYNGFTLSEKLFIRFYIRCKTDRNCFYFRTSKN